MDIGENLLSGRFISRYSSLPREIVERHSLGIFKIRLMEVPANILWGACLHWQAKWALRPCPVRGGLCASAKETERAGCQLRSPGLPCVRGRGAGSASKLPPWHWKWWAGLRGRPGGRHWNPFYNKHLGTFLANDGREGGAQQVTTGREGVRAAVLPRDCSASRGTCWDPARRAAAPHGELHLAPGTLVSRLCLQGSKPPSSLTARFSHLQKKLSHTVN